MPPKAATTSEEQFLAACFKHCVDKPKVDFNKLALAVGMSSGGAANKFRAILKKFEDDGDVTWAGDGNTTLSGSDTKPATPAKRKATPRKVTKAATVIKNGSVDSCEDENGAEEEEPLKKKAKTPSKKRAMGTKVSKKDAQSGVDQDDAEPEGQMDVNGKNSEEDEVLEEASAT